MTANAKTSWSRNENGTLISSCKRWRIEPSMTHRGWFWLFDEKTGGSRSFISVEDAKQYVSMQGEII